MSSEWPTAQLKSKHQKRWLWLLPVLALIGALVLVYQSTSRQGIPIIITFQNGYGIKVGDTLRYRGINVGLIDAVKLSQQLDKIDVSIQLNREAKDLARDGSHFWIVHPQFDLEGVAGLDTLLGAKYIAVLPGQGDFQHKFIGLDNVPLLEDMPAGGLEVVLQARQKGSLRVGASVNFRGLPVGRVISVELASDASAVDAKIYIEPRYVRLLSTATQFWQDNGAQFRGSLTSGFSFRMGSLQSILSGQIHFATPNYSTKPLVNGHRYILYDKPQSDWLTWKPAIPVETQMLSRAQPKPLRAVLRWQHKGWVFSRQKQRHGWLLPVPGGVLSTVDFLHSPEGASALQLQIDNKVVDLKAVKALTNDIVMMPYQHQFDAWPLRHQVYKTVVDTQIIADASIAPKFVSAARYQKKAKTWLIDKKIKFTDQWHGAAVVDMDGKLLGMLIVQGATQSYVALLSSVIQVNNKGNIHE